MSIIYAANTINDLYAFPQLDFHPLKGNLKGKHAIKITERTRLIVTIENKTTLIIEDVSTKHYE